VLFRHITIKWELKIREVHFSTDPGRMKRPLVIVYNNIEEYDIAVREGKPIEYKQWINLTKTMIDDLRANKITMEDLEELQIVEYISPEEQLNCWYAPSIDDLRKYQNDIRYHFTHLDIEQAIFGVVVLSSPLASDSNAVRNTMYTNHRKQSASWFALNYPFRIDKNMTLQHYCDYPLISAFSDMLSYPTGHTPIVALALYDGYNVEDSLHVNQSSIDCGMYNASQYNSERTELERGEQFMNPDVARTQDIKREANYSNINNGFVREGTLVQKGDVLIVKIAKLQKPTSNYIYADKSIIHKKPEAMRVEKVIVVRNSDGVTTAKVKLRSDRPLSVGDKLSSRTGNKGIVGITAPRCDMPYLADGTVVDIIVNVHSIPTRMAINQLIECAMGQLAARKGASEDATVFRKIDVHAIFKELEDRGIKYGGNKQAFNGHTGEPIDTFMFVGPTTYNRLQKFAIDEHYAVRTGPTSALTHQPLAGKHSDGGLRLGEMEKDVLCAHGTMRAFFNKFYTDSDGIENVICRKCGGYAIINEQRDIYKCKKCSHAAEFATVKTSWGANLLHNMLTAMSVKPEYEIAPIVFPRDM
jgi:DNA-directed RNA polymerase II subunit RPB2